jgi:hypothetical protein
MIYISVLKVKAAAKRSKFFLFLFKASVALHPYNIKKFLAILSSYVFPVKKQLNFLENDIFLNCIINNRLSFIRWGDGETNIINGMGIGTQHIANPPKNGRTVQEVSPLMQKKMKLILEYFSRNRSEKILFCVPYVFYKPIVYNNYNYNFKDYSFKKRKNHALTMYTLRRVILTQDRVGDSLIMRSYLNNNKIDCLWRNFNYMILLHNNSFAKQRVLRSFNGEIFFIEIQSANAFFDYEAKYNEITMLIESQNLNQDNACMVVCAGPMAKVLIFDLHQNFSNPPVCYDFGRFFEMERDSQF